MVACESRTFGIQQLLMLPRSHMCTYRGPVVSLQYYRTACQRVLIRQVHSRQQRSAPSVGVRRALCSGNGPTNTSSGTKTEKATDEAKKEDREEILNRIRESNRKKAQDDFLVSAESLIASNVNPVTGEVGGPRGPEPTRHGDWHIRGRVTDF